MKARQIRARILRNEPVKEMRGISSGGSPRFSKATLSAGHIAKNAAPGQFVMVNCSDGYGPLLRRPLGIHSVKGFCIDILYEIVGEGTKILSQKKSGGYLDVIGPLGSGFDYYSPLATHRSSILVAGGMGVAPLLFLAEKIKQNYPLVLIGARTKSQILCGQEFKKLGCDVKIATDDGSKGHKGFVTDLLKDLLSAKPWPAEIVSQGRRYPLACRDIKPGQALNAIYACGPRPMLKEISVISRQYKIPAQISLEEHMACGIGACLGCVVDTIDGYKRVCKEGPVFNAEEITW